VKLKQISSQRVKHVSVITYASQYSSCSTSLQIVLMVNAVGLVSDGSRQAD